jgi:DNA-directed RNA polymerase subunit N (RpoN/RPB10)
MIIPVRCFTCGKVRDSTIVRFDFQFFISLSAICAECRAFQTAEALSELQEQSCMQNITQSWDRRSTSAELVDTRLLLFIRPSSR